MNIDRVPQSIRVSQYSNWSGDISLDEIRKSNPASPASTANQIEQTQSSSSNSVISPPDPPPLPSGNHPTKELVIALYKFESDVDGDLSFKVRNI